MNRLTSSEDNHQLVKNPVQVSNIWKKVSSHIPESIERTVSGPLHRETENQPYTDATEISRIKMQEKSNDLKNVIGVEHRHDSLEGYNVGCVHTSDAYVRSLRIDGFVRPLLVSRVRELIAKTGTIEGFWMNRVKSFCYVILSTPNEAMTTLKAVQGLKFPDERTYRQTLSAKYVCWTEAKDVIDGKVDPPHSVIQPYCNENKYDSESFQCPLKVMDCLETTVANSFIQITHSYKEKERSRIPCSTESHVLTSDKTSANTISALDKLFKKTVSTPCIYWLPISEDQATKKIKKDET
jgi:apoptotic chromatin condensation inducer in the nucleus